MCRDLSRTYRYIKVLCNTSYFQGRNSDEDVYNQFAKFFIQLSFSLFIPLLFFRKCNMHSVDYNLSCRIMKCKNKMTKRNIFSEMPLDKGSAAMSYLRFCFVVLIEAIKVILISRQRFSNRSYSAREIIFVLLNNKSQ